jgi:RecA-family ATPase
MPNGQVVFHPSFVHVLPNVKVFLEAIKRNEVRKEWGIGSLAEAIASKMEKPAEVIKGGILLQASANLTSGQQHAMKSYAWLAAAIEAATRQTVWGSLPAPDVKRTIYIEIEDPKWMVEKRVKKIAKGLGLTTAEIRNSGFEYVAVPPFNLKTPQQEKRLTTLIKTLRPDFMVISTLQATLNGGEDMRQQQDMAPVMQAVLRLSRLCPSVLLTHSPRNNRQKRAYGAVTQDANFATLVHFTKSTKKKNTIVATLDSKELAATDDFEIKVIDTPNGGIKFECVGTPVQNQVAKFIRDNPTMSGRAIAKQT